MCGKSFSQDSVFNKLWKYLSLSCSHIEINSCHKENWCVNLIGKDVFGAGKGSGNGWVRRVGVV